MKPRQGHKSGALSRVCPGRSLAKVKPFLIDLDIKWSRTMQGQLSPNILISGHLKFSDSKKLGSEKPRKHNTEAQIPVVIGVLITSHIQ